MCEPEVQFGSSGEILPNEAVEPRCGASWSRGIETTVEIDFESMREARDEP